MKNVIAIVACLAMSGQALAINKCTDARGKAVFQDAPCHGKGDKIEVRSATGTPPPAAPASAPATPGAAAKPKLDSSTELRRIELETYLVKNKRDQVAGTNADCQRRLAQLAESKKDAANNLAGAVYETSVSSEMQSVSVMCQSKTMQLQAELQELERELREIKSRR